MSDLRPLDADLYEEILEKSGADELAEWQAVVVHNAHGELEMMGPSRGLSRSDCEGLILNAARQEPWERARFFIVIRDDGKRWIRELDRSRWHFPLCRRGQGVPKRQRPSGLA